MTDDLIEAAAFVKDRRRLVQKITETKTDLSFAINPLRFLEL